MKSTEIDISQKVLMDAFTGLACLIIFYVCYKVFDYLLRLPHLSSLDSRYVMITGCDSGFGQASAKHLDSLGVNVIAGCLTEQGETHLRKGCSNRLKTVHLDITNHENVLKAFNEMKGFLPEGKGKFYTLLHSHKFTAILNGFLF